MSVVRDQNQDERRLSSEAYRNQSGFTTEDPNEPIQLNPLQSGRIDELILNLWQRSV
ncbi:hypothetical protein KFU94_08180 [Chloroflexi bacterium TSY]|nr:hypothetical protein [Chloroflexi bacterium TSY]